MSVQITKEMFDEYVKANNDNGWNDPTNLWSHIMTSLNRKEWDIIARDYDKFAKEWSKDD